MSPVEDCDGVVMPVIPTSDIFLVELEDHKPMGPIRFQACSLLLGIVTIVSLFTSSV